MKERGHLHTEKKQKTDTVCGFSNIILVQLQNECLAYPSLQELKNNVLTEWSEYQSQAPEQNKSFWSFGVGICIGVEQ